MANPHFARRFSDWLRSAAALTLVTVVVACGGGGGGGGGSSSGSANTGALPVSPTQQPITPGAANAVPVTVGSGVSSVINIPTVSVTICAPNTTNCQTIVNVQVDTGSYGLRIASAVLNSTLNAALTPATAPSVAGATLAECTRFADGYSWGTVRTATVEVGGETAENVPVQVVGDLPSSGRPVANVPSGCVNGNELDTPTQLGANGILGIGVSPNDCGANCQTAISSNYFACPSGSACVRTAVPIANQVTNPVTLFGTDNNGVILQLPPVSNTGSSGATGTLVFGIGTQANNTMAAAQTLTTDAYGDLTGSFNGATVLTFFDSGSNAYFLNDSALITCSSQYSGFYCPNAGVSLPVSITGQNSVTTTATLGVLSAASLFSNSSNFAFNDLAAQGSAGTVDIGLPFFYGRYLYVGIAVGSQKPFIAY